MNAHRDIDPLPDHIDDSWGVSVTDGIERSRRTAWIVAGIAAAVALLEAIAIVILLPLKTVEPYTLLVDRQTGHVEALSPIEQTTIAPDAALTRSFLVQYIIARESFDANNVQEDFRKVTLWSAGDARERYTRLMQASNPLSPLSSYPRNAIVKVEVRSVSSLSADTSLVRFTTTQTDAGGQPQASQFWAAVISYRFSGAEMVAEDRLVNPLGFQVTRYRKDAETLPEMLPPIQAVPQSRSEGPIP